MGILNVTPDSFSGDGLLATAPTRSAPRSSWPDGWWPTVPTSSTSAVPRAGPVMPESRAGEEIARVVPVIRAVADALPDVVLSVDTTSPVVRGRGP